MASDAVERVGLVVVDELHLVGDESRGFLLEVLLSKVNFIAKTTKRSIQVVGMTATLGNLPVVCEWLDATLFESAFRPSTLKEYLCVNNAVFTKPSHFSEVTREFMQELFVSELPPPPAAGTSLDPAFVSVVWSALVKEGTVLVFCSTKLACEKVAAALAEALPSFKTRLSNDVTVAGREQLVQALRLQGHGGDDLAALFEKGAAFHHSGLSSEERRLVEKGYLDGFISLLCATSTLAAGVNLPATRVVFHSPYIAANFLDSTRYRQMAGRAGRTGHGGAGDAVLCVEEKDVSRALTVMTSEAADAKSQLNRCGNFGICRLVLEITASLTARNVKLFRDGPGISLDVLARCTLAARDAGAENVTTMVVAAVATLKQLNLVYEVGPRIVATSVGLAAAQGHLNPWEAAYIFEEAQVVAKALMLSTQLAPMYLLAPLPNQAALAAALENEDTELYLPTNFRLLSRLLRCLDSCALFWLESALGVSRATVDDKARHKMTKGGTTGLGARLQVRLWRLQSALLLSNMAAGVLTLSDVAQSLEIGRGEVQSLQTSTLTTAHNVRRFFESLKWWPLAAVAEALMPSLRFGVTPQLVPLVKSMPDVPVRLAK